MALAFNAGNFGPVSAVIREKPPEAQLIVCADDDAGTPGNPGLTHARDAARAVGAPTYAAITSSSAPFPFIFWRWPIPGSARPTCDMIFSTGLRDWETGRRQEMAADPPRASLSQFATFQLWVYPIGGFVAGGVFGVHWFLKLTESNVHAVCGR